MAMYSARGAHAAQRARVTARGAVDPPTRQGVAQAAGWGNGAAMRRATLDGVVIEGCMRWWRRLAPRTRLALAGVALALLAALGVWGVAQVGLPPLAGAHAAHSPVPSHAGAISHGATTPTPTSTSPLTHTSPVVLLGRLCVWLFGVGAYPTLALLLALGALWVAEGVARRRLLRRWLAAPTLALWLLIELGGRLIGRQAAGGALGDALATPLAHTPLIVAQLLVLLLAILLALVIGATLANEVANGLVAVPGMTARALRRRSRAQRIPPAHPAPTPHSTGGHRFAADTGKDNGADADKDEDADADADANAIHAHAAYRGATDRAENLGVSHQQRGNPLIEAWVGKAAHVGDQRQGKSAHWAAPDERPDDVVAWAEELAGRAQQALLAQRAVTQVYPLRITARTIRLCVRPVERLKRDAVGRIVTDAQGAPVVVRTRVSRILALRAELALALGAPTLRLMPLSPEEAPDTDQPAIVVELPRG